MKLGQATDEQTRLEPRLTLAFSENGPSNWATYPGGTYRGLKNYLELVTPHYTFVVREIAQELLALRTLYPQLPSTLGDTFTTWAMGKFNTAVALIQSHIGNTVGFYKDWYTIDGPS